MTSRRFLGANPKGQGSPIKYAGQGPCIAAKAVTLTGWSGHAPARQQGKLARGTKYE